MTSGRKLTKHQVREILRLAGLEREDGEWLLSCQRIAEEVGVHRRTVSRQLRRTAVGACQICALQKSHQIFYP